MTDMVNHPPHYEPMPGVDFDCIAVARNLTFSVGNAIKYMWRADRKNGREDIEKARWYVNDAVEHADSVYCGSREEWYLTNELLQCVSIAQTDLLRREFFELIRVRRLEDARDMLDSILK